MIEALFSTALGFLIGYFVAREEIKSKERHVRFRKSIGASYEDWM